MKYPETKQKAGKELAEKRWNASAPVATASKPLSFVKDTINKTGKSRHAIETRVNGGSEIPPPLFLE
jgi:hypothetical protein